MTTVSPAGLAGVGVLGAPSVTRPRGPTRGLLGPPSIFLSLTGFDALSATSGWGAGVAGLSVTSGTWSGTGGWGAVTVTSTQQPDVIIYPAGLTSAAQLGTATGSSTLRTAQVPALLAVGATLKVAVLLNGRAVAGTPVPNATVGTASRGNPVGVVGNVSGGVTVHPTAGNVTRNLD